MNRIVIYSMLCCLSACSGGIGSGTIFAPDHLLTSTDGKALLVTNRAASELMLLESDLQTIEKRITLSSPVNDLLYSNTNHLWAVCDGVSGKLYELNASDLTILSETPLGYSPSALVFNSLTGSLWIPQRFNNELWEINPESKTVLNKIAVGREPVDLVSFANDSLLLVVNNLPEVSSLAYPVACQIDIVDVTARKVVKRLMLPNGSTDVKAVAMNVTQQYAYVTHLIARYQLPTNQVDRGWMCTNALSVINLQTREVETTVLLDTPQKGAANPAAVTVSPNDDYLWIALSGTHEITRIDRKALHNRLDKVKNGQQVTPSTKSWNDIPNDTGFLHGIQQFIPTGGNGPRALAITTGGLVTANYYTGEIAGITLEGNSATMKRIGKALSSTAEGKGEMYFHDATIGYQSWQSCASCHPNDARTDGLNWDLLNDGVGNPKNTKTMLLAHQTAPCMITGIRKDAETAVRSGIKYILFAQVNETIPQAIDTYLKSLKPLPSPYLTDGKLSESATRGKASFNTHCAACHSGINYTDQKQYKVEWSAGSEVSRLMDVPALREVWRTAPYLYDGRCYTMREMLNVHGPKQQLPEAELNDLAVYVLSL